MSHATRRHTKIQPSAPFGWNITMSSCPSVREASGMSSRPAGSDPQLAKSTLCTRAECRRWPVISYMTRNGLAFASDRAAPST